jgi:hypothetical protein
MGAWGPGLYSGDFALDLKAIIAAVAKLPLETEKLVEAVCSARPDAASRFSDEEHAIFWLVTADQFEKRGIFSRRVREKAIDIIDGGTDAAMMQALGMKPGDIRKRAANLAELRARILAQPETTSPRKTLSEPEPYVFEVGGIYAYPTQQGHPINPYLAPKSFNRAAWSPDGFGLFLALGRGRAFDYLTWYHGATTFESFSSLPDEAQLTNEIRWRTPPVYGNCSLKHFQKLEMQEVGIFPIDPERRAHFFPYLASGEAFAIQDIGISEKLEIGRPEPRNWGRRPDGKLEPIVYPSPPTLDELMHKK